MDNSTLKELFKGMSQGDRESFVRIYEEFKKPIFTVVFRILPSRESAEDVTQEFFIKIFKDPSVSEIKNYRAWLFTVARNMAIDCLRSDRKNAELDIELGYEQDIDLNIDLERAMRCLGREEREIVTLHLNCELTFSEISKIMNLSLPSVYRRYQKAIKALRKYLQGGYYG